MGRFFIKSRETGILPVAAIPNKSPQRHKEHKENLSILGAIAAFLNSEVDKFCCFWDYILIIG
ncbi:MAG: hypothetical protein F6J96_20820 [Symploca sp. SIO1C2]|nr:hypothetical protein [Symploca sp. SIO1C2]